MSGSTLRGLEPLESRRLLTVPAGFDERVLFTIATETATAMRFAPDGRLFICDTGNHSVRVVKNGKLLSTPALTLDVDTFRERGIESIAFDPDFATNRFVYIYYTKADPKHPEQEDSEAVNRLSRFRMSTSSPDVIDRNSELVLLDNVPTPSGFHNAGAMFFGTDGMLYLGTGEGGRGVVSQDLSHLGGKILRLDVAHPSDLIPDDNPFAGQGGKRGEVWAYGFRNPFSGAVQPGTGAIFVNDVGDSSWEEVNRLQRGGNYGWPGAEGPTSDSSLVSPVYAHNHNGVRSAIVGAAFYTGTAFPAAYRGKYFFGDYARGTIRALDTSTGVATDFATNEGSLTGLAAAPDGSLWTLNVNGEVRQIRYVGAGANRTPVAVATANPTSGLPPLTVKFSGLGSIDPDGDALTYDWDFGDGPDASDVDARDVTHTYAAAGTHRVTLTVRDGRGGSATSDEITIVAGDDAPTGAIVTPLPSQVYHGGDRIQLSATGGDVQDGVLPDTAFTWSVVFHHGEHTHPFLSGIVGSAATITIPRTGEYDPDQFYRVQLTVTDSAGLTHSTFTDLLPETSTIHLASNIPGLSVTLEGEPRETPADVVSVEGMVRTLGGTLRQTVNGKQYELVGWSDGGAPTHDIITPRDDVTYTAIFEPVGYLPPAWETADIGAVGTAGSAAATGDAIRVRGAGHDIGGGADAMRFAYKQLGGDGRIIARLADMQFTDISAKAGVMIRDGLDPGAREASMFITPRSGLWVMARTEADNSTETAMVRGGRLPRWLSVTRAGDRVLFHLSEDGVAWERVAVGTVAMGDDVLVGLAVTSRHTDLLNAAVFDRIDVTGHQIIGLNPTADAYVRGGLSGDLNFGGDTTLGTKSGGTAGNERETYLRFDLSDVETVGKAMLRVFGRLVTEESPSMNVGVFGLGTTSWGENTITFDNRPTTSGSALSTAKVVGVAGAWYTWDLTSYIKSQVKQGKDTVTLVLKSVEATTAPAAYESREALGFRPELLITG